MGAILLLAAVQALTIAPVANADLGASFASASAVCQPSSGSTDSTSASTPPVAQAHSDVIARVQVSGGPADIYGQWPYATDYYMGDGDVAWIDLGPVDVNSQVSVNIQCYRSPSAVNATVDFFDRPGTSVAFAGISTWIATNQDLSDGSDLAFIAPGEARYVADITLQQGAIDLSWSVPNSYQTVASSTEVPLGVLGAGTQDLFVTPQDGPPAKWSITIHALPVRMLSLSVDRKYARPSQVDTFSYQYEGNVSESVTIQNSAGQVVRTLATGLPVDSNQHSLVWDGLDSTGAPVPDGVYNAVFNWTDPAGYTGSAATALTIDSTPPVATILSPLPLAESHGLVFSIGDALSGVASTKATVDGTRVPNVPSSGGTVVYEPSGGWTTGQHVLDITATDNAGNKLTFEKSFDVAAPPQSRRPTAFRQCAFRSGGGGGLVGNNLQYAVKPPYQISISRPVLSRISRKLRYKRGGYEPPLECWIAVDVARYAASAWADRWTGDNGSANVTIGYILGNLRIGRFFCQGRRPPSNTRVNETCTHPAGSFPGAIAVRFAITHA